MVYFYIYDSNNLSLNDTNIYELTHMITNNFILIKYFHYINCCDDKIKIYFGKRLSNSKKKILSKIVDDFLLNVKKSLYNACDTCVTNSVLNWQYSLLVYNFNSTIYNCVLTIIKPKNYKFSKIQFLSNILNNGDSYFVKIYNVTNNKVMAKKHCTNKDEQISEINHFFHNMEDEFTVEICIKTDLNSIIQLKSIHIILN